MKRVQKGHVTLKWYVQPRPVRGNDIASDSVDQRWWLRTALFIDVLCLRLLTPTAGISEASQGLD